MTNDITASYIFCLERWHKEWQKNNFLKSKFTNPVALLLASLHKVSSLEDLHSKLTPYLAKKSLDVGLHKLISQMRQQVEAINQDVDTAKELLDKNALLDTQHDVIQFLRALLNNPKALLDCSIPSVVKIIISEAIPFDRLLHYLDGLKGTVDNDGIQIRAGDFSKITAQNNTHQTCLNLLARLRNHPHHDDDEWYHAANGLLQTSLHIYEHCATFAEQQSLHRTSLIN